MNKRGMLGNIIGGFITILIGFTLLTTISQQISLAINCGVNATNISMPNVSITDIPQADTGKTGSFGGGGTGHFGGYDGTVKKSWIDAAGQLAPIKLEKSMFNPDCVPLSDANKIIIRLVPGFFALGLLGVGIIICYSVIISVGLLGEAGVM